MNKTEMNKSLKSRTITPTKTAWFVLQMIRQKNKQERINLRKYKTVGSNVTEMKKLNYPLRTRPFKLDLKNLVTTCFPKMVLIFKVSRSMS